MIQLRVFQTILFLLCTALTIAQESQWEFEEGKFVYLRKEDGFVIIDENYEYFTTDAISFEKRKHAYALSTNRFLRFPHPKRTLFYHSGGGILYEYLNDSLVRIDNSYQWNSRYGAAPFVMNDTLFLSGGYGELSHSYNIIYFDNIRKGWFLYDLTSETLHNKYAHIVHYDSINNSLLFLGHSKTSDLDLLLYKINMSTKESTSAPFNTNNLIEVKKPYINHRLPFFAIYNTSKPSTTNYIYLITFNNFKFLKSEFNFDENRNTNFLDYNSNTDAFLTQDNTTNKLQILPFKHFFGNNSQTLDFSQASSSNYNIYMILVLAVLVILILRLNNTRASRNVFDCIIKNKQHISRQISTNQNIMLDLILEKHPNWITLPDLSVDLYEDYSHDSKQKKIRKDLKEIEKIVLQECKLSDKTIVFHFDQSPDDKRIKTIALA